MQGSPVPDTLIPWFHIHPNSPCWSNLLVESFPQFMSELPSLLGLVYHRGDVVVQIFKRFQERESFLSEMNSLFYWTCISPPLALRVLLILKTLLGVEQRCSIYLKSFFLAHPSFWCFVVTLFILCQRLKFTLIRENWRTQRNIWS